MKCDLTSRSTSADSLCPVNLGCSTRLLLKAGSVLLALLAPVQQGLHQVQRNTCFPKTEDVAEQVLHTGPSFVPDGIYPKTAPGLVQTRRSEM